MHHGADHLPSINSRSTIFSTPSETDAAMIHSIFILNNTGQVIIEKHYRGNATRTETVSFWSQTAKTVKGLPVDVLPFLQTPKGTIVHLHRNGLFLLASTFSDTHPAFATSFLSTLADTLHDYFGELNEHAIKDNFITVYELLDEMLDHGHPLTLERNTLKELIQTPTMFNKVLDSLGASGTDAQKHLPSYTPFSKLQPSTIPWRRSGVQYAQNEVFVDVVETINCIFSSSRRSVSSLSVSGAVKVNSRLSGMPDVTMHMRCQGHGMGHSAELSMSRSSSMGNNSLQPILDDTAFHHCVRTQRFEQTGALSFVPPDGQFTLMSFAIRDARYVPLPVDVQFRIDYHGTDSAAVSLALVTKFSPPPPPSSRLAAPATGPGAGASSIGLPGVGSIGSGIGGGTGSTTTTQGSATSTPSMMLTSVTNAFAGGAKSLTASFYEQDAIMDQVKVTIPFGDGVSGAALSANVGNVQFDASTGVCDWNIGMVGRGKTPSMLGNITVKKDTAAKLVTPPVLLNFRIPGYSASGITVDSLELGTSETYRYFKGLRCITKAGTFEVRP